MRTQQAKRNRILIWILVILVLAIIVCGGYLWWLRSRVGSSNTASTPVAGYSADSDGVRRLEEMLLGTNSEQYYGLPVDQFDDIIKDEVRKGESLSTILNGRYGVPLAMVNNLAEMSKNHLKVIRSGNTFAAFVKKDTDSTERLLYMAYDKSNMEYVLFNCQPGQESVTLHRREVTVRERYLEGVIESSLYATIQNAGVPPERVNEMVAKVENIYQWSIDFFALQKGDKFRMIYEERVVDTTVVGIKKIYGAEFIHFGKQYLAVSFQQGDEDGYWDQNNHNLRKNFLAKPLSYSARVSSRFGTRVHPIKRTRNEHNGVDYACPTGTQIFAVADGTITVRGWDPSGGGNYIKIKHSKGYETLYMHQSKFAPGLNVGSRVRQGQLIGYVGSTGMSTGPHLHYAVKKEGRYINPEAIKAEPSDPIHESSKAAFTERKNEIIDVFKSYDPNW